MKHQAYQLAFSTMHSFHHYHTLEAYLTPSPIISNLC